MKRKTCADCIQYWNGYCKILAKRVNINTPACAYGKKKMMKKNETKVKIPY